MIRHDRNSPLNGKNVKNNMACCVVSQETDGKEPIGTLAPEIGCPRSLEGSTLQHETTIQHLRLKNPYFWPRAQSVFIPAIIIMAW